jgi:hypothetical protein
MDSKAIQDHDHKLIDLARYAASRGGITSSSKEQVHSCFSQFKRMVMAGEFTIAELTESVYSIHGDPSYKPELFVLGCRDPEPGDLKVMPFLEIC